MITAAKKVGPFYNATMIVFIVVGTLSFISRIAGLNTYFVKLASTTAQSDITYLTYNIIASFIQLFLALLIIAMATLALTGWTANKKTKYFSGIFAVKALVGTLYQILIILAIALSQEADQVGSSLLGFFGDSSFIVALVATGFFIAAYFLRQKKITWQMLTYAALIVQIVIFTISTSRTLSAEYTYGENALTIGSNITSVVLYDLLDIFALIDVHHQPYELTQA
jgi:hypothetical protein